jgi:hypothetical protein
MGREEVMESGAGVGGVSGWVGVRRALWCYICLSFEGIRLTG